MNMYTYILMLMYRYINMYISIQLYVLIKQSYCTFVVCEKQNKNGTIKGKKTKLNEYHE